MLNTRVRNPYVILMAGTVLVVVGFVCAGLAGFMWPSGPRTTETTSFGMATLAERAEFLHRYVKFRRTYETLEFDIRFLNGGGLGPSEWDIKIVATVPAAEIPAWIPPVAAASTSPDATWLKTVPTGLDLGGVSEWYVDGGRTVGVDRARRIVVYRLYAN